MCRAATDDSTQFVRDVLFSDEPFAFAAQPTAYQEFRGEIGRLLGVSSSDIILVGSGQLGFSLNPVRLLQLFTPSSDLDLVVVSSTIFDATSLELLSRAKEIVLAGEDERKRLRKSRENIAFGYHRPDQLPLACGLAKNWFPKLAGRFENGVARIHPVKAWLFKSQEHAMLYYAGQLERIQSDLAKMLSLRGDL